MGRKDAPRTRIPCTRDGAHSGERPIHDRLFPKARIWYQLRVRRYRGYNQGSSGFLQILYIILTNIIFDSQDGAFDDAVKGVDAIEHTASPFNLKVQGPQGELLDLRTVYGFLSFLRSYRSGCPGNCEYPQECIGIRVCYGDPILPCES